MRLIKFVLKRFLFATPQIVGITFVTFLIVRLLPGNPAYQLAGPYATSDAIQNVQIRLGLDKPVYVQYLLYLKALIHGDFGDSWFTARPVREEFLNRFPATLELILVATMIIVLGGIVIGSIAALKRIRVVDTVITVYGFLSGALPDFWLGLVLAFAFFFVFGLLPPPVGRLAEGIDPPHVITGMYTFDSLLTGNWEAFRSAVSHLILPTLTLVIVYMGSIVKMTKATVTAMIRSDFCVYARACGLPDRLVLQYALWNSLPPVITLAGLTFGYLLGGAVLVENVFSWGGLGSYAVASVARSDYFPVQAFVLLAAVFNLAIYLVIDLVHAWIDPRVEI
jgi:peptide/nickel transport system permease protein